MQGNSKLGQPAPSNLTLLHSSRAVVIWHRPTMWHQPLHCRHCISPFLSRALLATSHGSGKSKKKPHPAQVLRLEPVVVTT